MFKEVLYHRQADCDCGDHIRHNDGGNYHEVYRLVEYSTPERVCVVEVRTTTRDDFPGDKFEALVVTPEGFALRHQDDFYVPGGHFGHPLFRAGEARILWEGLA